MPNPTQPALGVRYAEILSLIVRLIDLSIVNATWVLMLLLQPNAILAPTSEKSLAFLAFTSLLVILVFPMFGIYRSWRGRNLIDLLFRLTAAWSIVLVLSLIHI